MFDPSIGNLQKIGNKSYKVVPPNNAKLVNHYSKWPLESAKRGIYEGSYTNSHFICNLLIGPLMS